MKIAMFSDSYLPYASGVVRSVETFTKELRRLGNEVYIIAPAYPGWRDNDPQVIRFPSYRFSRQSDFRLAWPLSRHQISKISDVGFDIIHSHSPFLLGRLGAAVAARLDVPLVFTYHTMYGDYAHYFKWLPRPITKRLVNKYVLSYGDRAATVIAPSPAVRDMLAGSGMRRPIRVLATGVDLTEFADNRDIDVRARFGIAKGAPLLLFVGRLGREKNLRTLLEAVAPALRSRPEARLLLVGDGPDRAHLWRLAHKLEIGGQTVFAGVLGRRDVVSAYKAADLFVFSSLTETQGLVVSEALTAGLPVVALRANVVEQAINDGVNGLLTGQSADELGSAIRALLEDAKQLAALSRNAANRGPSLSTVNKARELRDIYSGVLSGANRPPAAANLTSAGAG